ncbi:MAG: porin, partial [Deltaproteobacteria bacterium]|nr:porin [Deltaproteobacteria bacterium]
MVFNLRNLYFFVVLGLLLFSVSVYAQEPNSVSKSNEVELKNKTKTQSSLTEKIYPTLKFKGKFFGDFSINTSDQSVDGNDINETGFNISRLYLTAKSKISKKFSARATLDFGRFTGDATDIGSDPLFGYIKYAYLDFKPLKNIKLRFGQQARVWVGNADKVMNYRYVFKSSMDYFKLMSSADLGFSVLGNYGKMFNYQVGVFNGTGYKKTAGGEEIFNLLMEARVSVFPLINSKLGFVEKLGLHFYGGTDGEEDGEGESIRNMIYGGALSLNHKYFDFMVEFMMMNSDIEEMDDVMVVSPYLSVKYKNMALFGTWGM